MMIRKMTQLDVSQVAAIEKTAFSQPWSERAFLESLANESAYFLVAQENEITGYVGMYVSFEEGEITNVAVRENCREKGVGEALIRRLLSDASVLGVTRIVLEARISNEPAIRLYEKCGFRKLTTRKGFYAFPKEDADIMVWEAFME